MPRNNRPPANPDHPVVLLRRKLKLTQAALADELGITVVAVSRWENGHAKPHRSSMRKFQKMTEELRKDQREKVEEAFRAAGLPLEGRVEGDEADEQA